MMKRNKKDSGEGLTFHPLRHLRPFLAGVGKSQIGLYASSGAFFLFLALFPMAVLGCALLPLTDLNQEVILEQLSAILPDVMGQLLQVILAQVYDSYAGLLPLSGILTLWSAGKAFFGLLRGLDRIFGAQKPLNFFRARLLSALYTLLLLLAMLVFMVLIMFRRRLLALLSAWELAQQLAEGLLRIRFLAAMLVLSLVFALLYRFLPRKSLPFNRQLPGALLASAGWMLLSWFFSFYVSRFGGGSVYGSLATVAFGLLWLYWCMYIILFGAYFNVYLEQLRAGIRTI